MSSLTYQKLNNHKFSSVPTASVINAIDTLTCIILIKRNLSLSWLIKSAKRKENKINCEIRNLFDYVEVRKDLKSKSYS